jgi:hypothetical protein
MGRVKGEERRVKPPLLPLSDEGAISSLFPLTEVIR